jgi:hypothetical protein
METFDESLGGKSSICDRPQDFSRHNNLGQQNIERSSLAG